MPVSRPLAVAATVAAALTLTACSSPEIDGTAQASDFEHVHDLGWDAATGTLFVATHIGLFSVKDGITNGPIGGMEHDLMSYARAEDGTMIAGGHPDPRAGWGNHMGFVRSDDGGVTWESLSLTGEVDFHDIEFTADGFIGFDSQTGVLASSTDGVTWNGLVDFALIDVATEPGGSAIAVTTPEGVGISDDGGATFSPVANAPAELIFLSWAAPDALYAMGVNGELYVSADGSATWTELGTTPGLGSFLATADGHLFVALPDGVWVSVDDGATWSDALAGE